MESENTAQHLVKSLTTAEALEYAEMHIIQRSVQEAIAAFDLYFKRIELDDDGNQDYQTINSALFRDGLIQIMSCFTTNLEKRSSYLIPSEVYQGIEGWQEFYNYMHANRDVYAAHTPGPKRQVETVGIYDSTTKKYIGIGQLGLFFVGEALGAKTEIARFCDAARTNVEARIVALGAVIEQQAASLSSESVDVLPDARLVPPHSADIRTGRARYMRKIRSQ